jgi:WD40 repeat protein
MSTHRFALCALFVLCATAMAQGDRVDRPGDALPPGALRRLGSSPETKHARGVASLHFIADGKILLSIGGDARTWNTATGAALNLAPAEDEQTDNWKMGLLAFNSNKQMVVSRRFGFMSRTRPDPRDDKRMISESRKYTMIWTWHLNDKAPSPAEVSYAEPDNIADLLPDACTFVHARADSSNLQICDTETGEVLNEITAHKGPIWQSDLLASGRFYLTRDDESVCIWDTSTWQELRRFSWTKTEGGAIAVSDQGRLLARAWDGQLEMWNLRTGRVSWQSAYSPSGKEWRLAFAPDGSTLAILSDRRRQLDIWDTATGKRLNQIRADKPKDSAAVIRAGHAALVALGYDTPRARAICTPMIDHQFQEQAGKIDREDFEEIHVTGTKPDRTRTFLKVWEDELHKWDLSTTKLEMTANGRIVVVLDKTLDWYDAVTGRSLGRLPPVGSSNISDFEFSPDGKMLATGHYDGSIILWDVSGLFDQQAPTLVKYSNAELEELWKELDQEQAIQQLIGAPRQAVLLLAPKLRSVTSPNPEKIARHIADLDSDDFEVRDHASRELAKYGKVAERPLKKELARKPSAEAKRRIDSLFADDHIDLQLAPEFRRVAGAVRTLELLGTESARVALDELARGRPNAWLTEEADEALRRLKSASQR